MVHPRPCQWGAENDVLLCPVMSCLHFWKFLGLQVENLSIVNSGFKIASWFMWGGSSKNYSKTIQFNNPLYEFGLDIASGPWHGALLHCLQLIVGRCQVFQEVVLSKHLAEMVVWLHEVISVMPKVSTIWVWPSKKIVLARTPSLLGCASN